ncbi:MAG: tetratricopeptide repeat protein [Verrucomicrobiota bacterium]|nr:tetratricopeptide repeat protein [Verrucomicrobiota bacterium]
MRVGVIFALCSCSLLAAPLLPEIGEEEALALRRIADFWQEGEFPLAKTQMEEFLEEFPDNPYSHTLCTALGDLLLREKNYQSALNYYSRISPSDSSERIFLNRMHCLYHLHSYASLADECEAYLTKTEGQDLPERNQAIYLLAISLYQQCLNASTEPATLQQLALRAKPYFEWLSKNNLSEDVSQAFAHLCYILEDYQTASNIYLHLSKTSEHPDELLFQAALLQSKYDQELALRTFEDLVEQRGPHAGDAAYNRLVLFFAHGRFEEIVARKEEFFDSLPPERVGIGHLLVGKSLFALHQYREATAELNAFLDSNTPAESVRPALVHLIEAASHEGDLALLDASIGRLKQFDANDPELSNAFFSRAQILKKSQNFPAAQAEFESFLARYSDSPLRAEASFELTHLASSQEQWGSCKTYARAFLKEFPNHEFAPFVWRHLARSSYELASKEPLPSRELKEQFAFDLDQMLRADNFLAPAERLDWQFLLAKTDYELRGYEETIQLLEPLLKTDVVFTERANAELLLALCFRDGLGDEVQFCQWAEKALSNQASLLPPTEQHIALFNAYLSNPDHFNRAADHLYQAFEANAPIQSRNLLWLANLSYAEAGKNPALAQRAIRIFSHFLEKRDTHDPLFTEEIRVKLYTLYHQADRETESDAILENLIADYQASPKTQWAHDQEAKLYLGEACLKRGEKERAEKLFEEAAEGRSIINNRFTASALLHSARLKIARLPKEQLTATHPDLLKAAAQLKALVLQKSLQNEPIHLEAALDYIDLQTLLEPASEKSAKKFFLLRKTKADFESKEDLLSQDYHAAEVRFPAKYQIYLSYKQFFEAEIFLAEADLSSDLERKKELRAIAKALFLQIADASLEPVLRERALQRLNSLKSVDEQPI